jgi:hypothetical protein
LGEASIAVLEKTYISITYPASLALLHLFLAASPKLFLEPVIEV